MRLLRCFAPRNDDGPAGSDNEVGTIQELSGSVTHPVFCPDQSGQNPPGGVSSEHPSQEGNKGNHFIEIAVRLVWWLLEGIIHPAERVISYLYESG